MGALKAVAASHWYPPVRKSADLAITHIYKKKPYPPRQFPDAPYEDYTEFFAYSHSYWNRKGVLLLSPKSKAVADLTVPEGRFVAADRGEWGGDLTFVAANGAKQTLLSENVCALARLGRDIVAVGGLAHMTLNEGLLYRVVGTASGTWAATKWRTLPGAPEWAEVRSHAGQPSLRVACVSGTVEVTADGAMYFIV